MRAAWTLGLVALAIAQRPAAAEPTRAVVAQVPSSTLGFIAIDLDRARASTAMMSAVASGVRALGLDDRADLLRTGASLVIAGVPGARTPAMIARGPATPGAFATGAIVLDAAAHQRLARILPDLGAIQWIAGTLEQAPSGFVLSGSAAFKDPYVAASVAIAIGMGRKVVATQLPAKVAAAVDKIAFTAMGASIRITATWSAADVAALLDAAR